jgi:FKBP-type peptidyl-prolyl cis-trans isomerase FkpA/FKBP-type peptidyl-prolyl cis-trans isomerase FklB
MRTVLTSSILAVLVAVSVAAAAPEPTTDEQKTLYALGVAMSQGLTSFNLTEASWSWSRPGSPTAC